MLPSNSTNSRMTHTSKVDHDVTMATQARRSSGQACCKFQGNHSDCLDDLNDIAMLLCGDGAAMEAKDRRDRLSSQGQAIDQRKVDGRLSQQQDLMEHRCLAFSPASSF